MVSTTELIGALIVAIIILLLPYMLESIVVKMAPKLYTKSNISEKDDTDYYINRLNEITVDGKESFSSSGIRNVNRK
ncbi:MAG: hypothetical protein GPJ54_07550 [Candidatus Heimdallarchaeota archaeon]|nr:hypothetical protein [Candidatus Heimdallarchaeota archaeon]